MKLLNASLMVGNEPNGFTDGLDQVFDCVHVPITNNINNDIIEKCEVFKPDLIFLQVQQSDVIKENTAQYLSRYKVINWTGDVRETTPQWMIDYGKLFYCTAFSNMVDVEHCRSLGINSKYLEIGFDPLIYCNHNFKNPTTDIVAHFNDYNCKFPLSKYRRDAVNSLRFNFLNNFGVFGAYAGAINDYNNNQINEAINYNNAKIAINISHFDYNMYSSDRLLRILGSGCFCLSHNFKGIDKIYEVNKHLVIFNDLNEMIDKTRYYLTHETERKEIAQNGMRFAHENFTFFNMAKNIERL